MANSGLQSIPGSRGKSGQVKSHRSGAVFGMGFLSMSHITAFCASFSGAADMPSRLRKTRKLRGNVSHSHGYVGKHRKHPGPRVILVAWVIGPGSTSTNHIQVTSEKLFLKQRSYYCQSRYCRYCVYDIVQILWPSLELQPTITWNQSFCPAVNLDKVWDQVHQPTGRNVARNRNGAAPIIDVVWSGYCKVLGKGKLPEQPVMVKAKFFSRRAQEKNWVVGVLHLGNSKPCRGRRSNKCQRMLYKKRQQQQQKQQQCFVSSRNL